MQLIRLMTKKQEETIQKLYRDLQWNVEQQQGFHRRMLNHDAPRTTQEAYKIIEALKAIIMRLYHPYQAEMIILANRLWQGRYELTPWESDTFLPDIIQKLNRAGNLKLVSPYGVKKLREIAHKYDLECGFPPARDLWQQHEDDHQQKEA